LSAKEAAKYTPHNSDAHGRCKYIIIHFRMNDKMEVDICQLEISAPR